MRRTARVHFISRSLNRIKPTTWNLFALWFDFFYCRSCSLMACHCLKWEIKYKKSQSLQEGIAKLSNSSEQPHKNAISCQRCALIVIKGLNQWFFHRFFRLLVIHSAHMTVHMHIARARTHTHFGRFGQMVSLYSHMCCFALRITITSLLVFCWNKRDTRKHPPSLEFHVHYICKFFDRSAVL